MFGGGSDDLAGIIPRASKHIFDHIASATEAREWSVKASFLEIYREQLRDLLNPSSAKLQIREQKKKIWVENLSEEYVATPEDVMDLISAGEKLRATSSTAMNETSSRSHSVFVLRVESKPATPDGAAARSAVLNLIDLAGSERVGKTGATGKTLQGFVVERKRKSFHLLCWLTFSVRRGSKNQSGELFEFCCSSLTCVRVCLPWGTSSVRFRRTKLRSMCRIETRSSLDCCKSPWEETAKPD
jgi:hypothetical protein